MSYGEAAIADRKLRNKKTNFFFSWKFYSLDVVLRLLSSPINWNVWDTLLEHPFCIQNFVKIKSKWSILPEQVVLALQNRGNPIHCKCNWSYIAGRWEGGSQQQTCHFLWWSKVFVEHPILNVAFRNHGSLAFFARDGKMVNWKSQYTANWKSQFTANLKFQFTANWKSRFMANWKSQFIQSHPKSYLIWNGSCKATLNPTWFGTTQPNTCMALFLDECREKGIIIPSQ